jgi:inward rectifier potassium channel
VRKPLKVSIPGADYQIRVVGHRQAPVRDFYHALLRMTWTGTFVAVAATFLTVNVLFAFGYELVGGIANARPGNVIDAFFFSVQTFGTIGYGNMYPQGAAANTLVVLESLLALILTALVTGLVFAKFSRSTARLMFTRDVVLSPVDGVPALSFRISNERGNQIVDARIRLVMIRKETTAEGMTFYRMLDLRPTRDHALSLSRSWTVMHRIDRDSPLHAATPESVIEQEVELQVLVVGLDETSMQSVHASHRYFTRDLRWGARHVDVISEDDAGDLVLDLHRFHDVEPTRPTAEFPYPRQ